MNLTIHSNLPLGRQIVISSVLGMGMSFLASRISGTALSWAASSIILTNQLWRQTIVSRLVPENNKAVSVVVSPITLLAARSLSWISGTPYFEWPIAAATIFVVGQTALNKGSLMNFFNVIPTAFHTIFDQVYKWTRTEDTCPSPKVELEKARANLKEGEKLGIKHNQRFHSPLFFCRPGSKLAEQDRERDELYIKTINEINKETNKTKKESQERIEKVKKEIEELEADYAAWKASYQKEGKKSEKNRETSYANAGCPKIDPRRYTKLSNLDRATHKDLNALCPEHAKAILSLNGEGFDSAKFNSSDDGCSYLKNIARKMMAAVHPDKNRNHPELSKLAFVNSLAAIETLARLHKPQACLK